jgi:predicted TIM-barrel enzyme
MIWTSFYDTMVGLLFMSDMRVRVVYLGRIGLLLMKVVPFLAGVHISDLTTSPPNWFTAAFASTLSFANIRFVFT